MFVFYMMVLIQQSIECSNLQVSFQSHTDGLEITHHSLLIERNHDFHCDNP